MIISVYLLCVAKQPWFDKNQLNRTRLLNTFFAGSPNFSPNLGKHPTKLTKKHRQILIFGALLNDIYYRNRGSGWIQSPKKKKKSHQPQCHMQPTKFPKKDTIQLRNFPKKNRMVEKPRNGREFHILASVIWSIIDFISVRPLISLDFKVLYNESGKHVDCSWYSWIWGGYRCHYQTYQNVEEWINQNQELLLDMFLVISTWLPYVVTVSYIEQHFAEPIPAFKAEQETWLFNSEVFCCRTRHKHLSLKCHKSQKSPWSDSKPFNMRMFQPFWWGCLSNPGSLVRGGGLPLQFFLGCIDIRLPRAGKIHQHASKNWKYQHLMKRRTALQLWVWTHPVYHVK